MASGYQTSDIVEKIPNTELSHKQCGQKHQLSDSHKAVENLVYADMEGKCRILDIPCLLCNSLSHPTNRCPQTRQLRDGVRPVPLNFCEVHCRKIYALCKEKTCALITTRKGKSLDLTCQEHKTKHILLCNKRRCHTVSKKYWKLFENRKQVVTLTPAKVEEF